jgi:hypothetical protein
VTHDPLKDWAGDAFRTKDATATAYTDNVYATQGHDGDFDDLEALYAMQFEPRPPPPLLGVLFLLVGIVLMVTMVVLATFAVISDADAHEAIPTSSKPLGWSYPFSCCSGYDCRPVEDVKETSTGYVVRTGEVISYQGDARLKDSPDGMFHWCSVAGADDGRTICLYAPPRGF